MRNLLLLSILSSSMLMGCYDSENRISSVEQQRPDGENPALRTMAVELTTSAGTGWSRTYGTALDEYAYSGAELAIGGYIMGGYALTAANGLDGMVVRTDASGAISDTANWPRTYSGAGDESINAILPTIDGGFIAVGSTTTSGAGGTDALVMKLNSTGAISWQKTYGGAGEDIAVSVQEVSDGVFIVAGCTNSFSASNDIWVIKLKKNPNGAIDWQKTYGSASDEIATSIEKTKDGSGVHNGYVVCGQSNASGTGNWDGILMTLDLSGNIIWQKYYNYSDMHDMISSVQQTSDGGFVIGGTSMKTVLVDPIFPKKDREYIIQEGGELLRPRFHISSNPFIAKLDASGAIVWQNFYYDRSIIWYQMDAEAFVRYQGIRYSMGTLTATPDGFVTTLIENGVASVVLKLTSAGTVQWAKNYGGSGSDALAVVRQASDGGLIAFGGTSSFGAGALDFWALKLPSDGQVSFDSASGGMVYDSVIEFAVGGIDAPLNSTFVATATSVSPVTASLVPVVMTGASSQSQTNPPTSFALLSPASGSSPKTLTPALTWQDSTDEQSYTVEIDNENTFAAPLFHSATLSADTTSYTVPSGILVNGTTYFWRVKASNSYGTTLASNSPFSFTPTDIVKIVAGGYHCLALKTDGSVWGWGDNYEGELGQGTDGYSSPQDLYRAIPTKVKGPGGVGYLSNIVDIAAGYWFSAAVKSDGTVYAWGDNAHDQIGNGIGGWSVHQPSPSQVKGPGGAGFLQNAIAIAAGGTYCIALLKDPTTQVTSVWGWGSNSVGELADGTTTERAYPVQSKMSGGAAITGVKAVSAEGGTSYALQGDRVLSWGSNYMGELGVGTYDLGAHPAAGYVLVSPGAQLTGISSISSGFEQGYALTDSNNDGIAENVYTWGRNLYGELGIGTTEQYKAYAVQMKDPTDASGNLRNVTSIVGGQWFTLAVKSDGTVYSCGSNDWGQLGNGTLTNTNVPTKITTLSNFAAVGAGIYHSMALNNMGRVWTWGRNEEAELGIGTQDYNTHPNPVQTNSF